MEVNWLVWNIPVTVVCEKHVLQSHLTSEHSQVRDCTPTGLFAVSLHCLDQIIKSLMARIIYDLLRIS